LGQNRRSSTPFKRMLKTAEFDWLKTAVLPYRTYSLTLC